MIKFARKPDKQLAAVVHQYGVGRFFDCRPINPWLRKGY
jgi:hypothetical protein